MPKTMTIMKCPPNLPSLASSAAATTHVQQQMKPHTLSLSSSSDISNLSFSSSSSSLSLTRFNNLGKKWMEYQGLSDWDTLLDPLDDNLRSEILRYGNFVQAAYQSFNLDPSSPSYATARCFRKNKLSGDHQGLPSTTGYKVTKRLRATSGIELPRWVEKAPIGVSARSSNIGYVAVCENEQEIKRLGRRDVVIAYRGTMTCLEWLENLRANLTHINPPKRFETEQDDDDDEDLNGAMVQRGFLSLYTSAASCDSFSLQQMVREEIRRVLQTYDGEALSFTLTGHSLGAALATLTAYDIKTALGLKQRTPMVTVISFGGPRVGDGRFRRELEKQGTKVLRIVNSDDVVTKVPGFVFEGDDDVAEGRGIHVADWVKKRLEDAQLTYAEVGKELRLCSRDSPYLRGLNAATCHDLNTYLHLIDGFVSSTCPFKATAKRFLRS